MKLVVLSLLVLAPFVHANELKSAQSKRIADQLVRTINEKVAEITALELAEGTQLKDIRIDLAQPNRFDSGRFGAILDANKAGRVVSVTPRSQASLIGLRSGDIIQSINGFDIDKNSRDWAAGLQYLPNDSDISITVDRLGNTVSLAGKMKAKYIPQWQLSSAESLSRDDEASLPLLPFWHTDNNAPIFATQYDEVFDSGDAKSCGRIILVNSLSISPPKYSGLKTTTVIKNVDGVLWGQDKSRLRVSVGTHNVRVGNKYDLPKEFRNFNLQIQPNTNYYIAYIRNKDWLDSNGQGLTLGKYTGPVIWKTTEQACEM